jgi:hypothetical protein
MEGHDCLRTFFSLCQPVQLPPPWDFLTPEGNPRRGPADPDSALATLLDRHGVQDLSSCGLVRSDAEGTPALNPLLRTAEVQLIAVMDAENKQPVDIVTSNGCLRTDRRPLFALWRDGFNRALPQEEGLFLLTATLGDAIVMRSLGFPAAPITGMEDLRGEEIDRLADCFTLTVEDETQACCNGSTDFKPRLTIVEWSPLEMNLAEPQAACKAIQYLLQLQRFRGLEMGAVGVWRPSADEFAAIQFAINRREAEWAWQAMHESLENARILDGPLDSERTSPASLVDAMGAILGVPRPSLPGALSGAEPTEARKRYEWALAERLIAPLVAMADAAVDPLESYRLIRLAQLVDLSNAKMRLARQLTEQAILGNGDPSERRKDSSIQEFLALSKEISNLVRSIPKRRREP